MVVVPPSLLPFAGRDQERVVELPSLDSPKREQRRRAGVGRVCKIRIFVDAQGKIRFISAAYPGT